MNRTRTIKTATAYIDDQDPSDIGWAYRLTYTDGHQESGAMAAPVVSDADAMLDELARLVGTEWGDGLVEYYRHDGGHYVWSAA